MKKLFFFCLIVCAVISQRVWAFDIVKNGQAKATIVIPKFENAPLEEKWTKKAAGWLADYVKQSTGAELKTVEEGQSVKGNIISIGHTKLANEADIKTDELKWDGCKLMVKNNILFLIGKDDFTPSGNDSLGPKGTCKAVTSFLEDCVGCRWFIPGPMGEFVPAKKDIVVSDEFSKTVTPIFAFAYGGGAEKRLGYDDSAPAAIANNQKIAVKIYDSVHGWNHFVPVSKYYKDHPEYFALINGQRCGTNWNHLCTSNPDVKEILIREIRKKFDEGYDWVGLGQSDGYRPCQCEKCQSLDNYKQGQLNDLNYRFNVLIPNPCERIHLLHKAIIDACKQSHPDKKIHLLIYDPTTWPSKKFDKYGDNVVGAVCHYFAYAFPAWAPKVWANTAYLYWWGDYHPGGIGPKVGAWQVAEQVRFMRNNNVIGIYQCGGAQNWGLEGPAYYTYGRMLGNPDLNPKDCVREYCNFAYGKAANTMYDFFDALYSRLQKDEDSILPVWTLMKKVDESKEYPYMTSVKFYPNFLSSELLQKLDSLLTQAEKEADSESSKKWLELSRVFFDFTKANIEMYKAYSDYINQPNKDQLMRVKMLVDKWKKMRDKLLSYGNNEEYRRNWFPEWKQIKNFFDSNGDGMSQIAEPVTLDFGKLEEELKGKDVK